MPRIGGQDLEERCLGFGQPIGGPEEVHQGEPRFDLRWRQADGAPERRFGFLRLASLHPHGAEGDERLAAVRIDRKGLFDLRDGAFGIAQCGKRVGVQQQRVDVVRIASQQCGCASPGLVEPAGEQQYLSGLELEFAIVG